MSELRRHRRNCNGPGHAHELTFSCYRGFPFLKADRTSQWLADAIETSRRELNYELWAYVLMPEHVHLLIRPRDIEYDIAAIRKAIKSPVGRQGIEYLQANARDWLPKVTRQRGKKIERLFWQSGGGYDRNVMEPVTLLRMIDYIHMNPVRRGLVERAEDWRWSMAAWFLAGGETPIAVDRIPPEWTG